MVWFGLVWLVFFNGDLIFLKKKAPAGAASLETGLIYYGDLTFLKKKAPAGAASLETGLIFCKSLYIPIYVPIYGYI